MKKTPKIISLLLGRYSDRVTEWFQEQYPNKNVTQINAGIGGTPSNLGMYRIGEQIGKHNPDVVFVEFTANDSYRYAADIKENVESMVRQMQEWEKQPVIVFVHSYCETEAGVSDKEICDNSLPAYSKVADWYGIPEINFFDYMENEVANGTTWWGVLSNDGVHPNAAGHEVYGNYIIDVIEAGGVLTRQEKTHTPMSYTLLDNPHLVLPADASIVRTGTWENVTSTDGGNYPGIKATEAGDTLELTFTGNTMGIMHMAGTANWVMDEGTDAEISGTVGTESTHSYPTLVSCASNLTGTHTIKITNTGTTNSTKFRFIAFLTSDGYEIVPSAIAENGDYVPGSVPKNYYASPSSKHAGNGTHYSSNFSYYQSTYPDLYFEAKNDLAHNTYWGNDGVWIEKANLYTTDLAQNTNYVFRALLREVEGNGNTYFNIVNNAKTGSNVVYPLEYGSVGMNPGSDWTEYVATIAVGELSETSTKLPLGVGLVTGNEGGTIEWKLSDGSYLAPEVAYDVTLEADTYTQIVAGKEATFEAKLVNQMGSEGSLAQGFTYALVDGNGNAVEGITLTPSEDTTSVTVSTAADTAYGTYYLKATDTTMNWQQTLEIKVSDKPEVYEDYVPGELTDNMVVNPGSSTTFTINKNGGIADIITSVAGEIGYKEKIQNNAYWGAGPTNLTVSKGLLNTGFVKGKNYIYSVRLRNVTPEIKETINFGLVTNVGSGNRKYWTVIPVTGSTFNTYKGGWTQNADCNNLCVGLADENRSALTTEQLGTAALDLSNGGSLYVAEEKAYDMEISSSSATVVAGRELTVDAKIKNQLGEQGNLTNDFEFVILSADRKNILTEGFTITEGENGAATIAIAETAAPGKYFVYAISALNEDIAKGVEFNVLDSAVYTDYVVGEKPQNMFADATKIGTFQYGNGNHGFTRVDWAGENYINLKEIAVSPSPYWGAGPVYVTCGTNTLTRGLVSGEKYVLSVTMRNPTPEIREEQVFGFNYTINQDPIRVSVKNTEYETSILNFTASKDSTGVWFGGDATINREAYTEDELGYLHISMEEDKQMYLAEEVVYDIIPEVENDVIWAGESTTVATKVVNQLMVEGTLSQGVEYEVLNADRSEAVDTITVSENEDGTFTVNVLENAESGEYIVFAKSTSYPELKKGVAITVINSESFADHTPGEIPENMFADATKIETFQFGNGNGHERVQYVGEEYINLKEKIAAASTYWGSGPVRTAVENNTLTRGLVKDQSYVLSVTLRNPTPEIREEQIFAFNHATNQEPIRVSVKNTEYETSILNFTATKDVASVWFGGDATIDRSAYTEDELGYLHISMEEETQMYLAEEVAYDINAWAVNGSEAPIGGTALVETEILNQLGVKGSLSQDIEWIILNSSRSAYADGITVTDNGDGTATVNVSDDAEIGEYVVYAKSAEYGIGKGIEITVTDAPAVSEKIASAVFTKTGTNVTFEATVSDTEAENIFFVIAEFNGTSLVQEAKSVVKAASDPTCDLTLEGVTAGNTVKAFIWNNATLIPIDNPDDLELSYVIAE